MRPLVSVQYLAHRLGVPLSELRELARNVKSHYRQWDSTDEKKGKTRTFNVPDKKLKLVQRRILRNILNDYKLPEGAHGGVKGRSPKTNAAKHCGKPFVVSQDIKKFYPSVSHRQVAAMFRREFDCGRETRWLLTRLTTVDGQLPQGAPTSTAIANILLTSTVDGPAQQYAEARDVTVTRFIDDFTFSGTQADSMINNTARSASRVGLRTWRKWKKLKFMPASGRQKVTGLTVNSPDGPSVPRERRDRVKAAIHQLHFMTDTEIEKQIPSIKGRLNHIKQHNPGTALRFHQQLERVLDARELSAT